MEEMQAREGDNWDKHLKLWYVWVHYSTSDRLLHRLNRGWAEGNPRCSIPRYHWRMWSQWVDDHAPVNGFPIISFQLHKERIITDTLYVYLYLPPYPISSPLFSPPFPPPFHYFHGYTCPITRTHKMFMTLIATFAHCYLHLRELILFTDCLVVFVYHDPPPPFFFIL